MRRFSSYGPIDTEEHFHAPRKALIENAYNQLLGENPQKGGHYITAWAPRKCWKNQKISLTWKQSFPVCDETFLFCKQIAHLEINVVLTCKQMLPDWEQFVPGREQKMDFPLYAPCGTIHTCK